MKVWIVVLALLLLFALIIRERFDTYEEALKSVGQTAGYILPRCETGYTLSSNKDSCEKTKEDGTKDKKQPTCPSGSHYVFRETEGNCEPDNVQAVSQSMTDPICSLGYTFNRDAGSCEKKNTDGSVSRVPGTCPDGSRVNDVGRCLSKSSSSSTSGQCNPGFERDILGKCVSKTTTPPVQQCPADYTFDEREGRCRKSVDATCPSGYTLSKEGCVNAAGDIVNAVCPEGGSYNIFAKNCELYADKITTSGTGSGTTSGTGTTSPQPSTSSTTTSAASVSTGGSSGNLIGPTSGKGIGKNIWGPIFSGIGESTSGSSGDSTKTLEYPELLGGNLGKSSARIDGVGIVPPSQPGLGLGLGVLPSSASLGTDANARFLPFSRQPGDMDVVSDPYRLANSYSTKNFSSQRDPVPFLTDFSAFYK